MTEPIRWTITVGATGLLHIRDALSRHRPAQKPGDLTLDANLGGFHAGPRPTMFDKRLTIPDLVAHEQLIDLIDGAIKSTFQGDVYNAVALSRLERVTIKLSVEQIAAMNHCLAASKNAPLRSGSTIPTRLHVWAAEALAKLPSVGDLIAAIGSLETLETQIDL